MFPSVPPSTDEYELRTQRISTRLFIIIFSISLIILLLYNSLDHVTKTVNIERPTLVDYSQLHSKYSDTLRCPCSKISLEYGQFLYVNYTLHQVCSSIFVNQAWINYLRHSVKTEFLIGEFRWISVYAFQALKVFCDLINHTISNRLIEFNSNQYATAFVVSQTLFESETTSLMNQLRSSLTNRFLLSIAMIQDTTQANALFSALQSSYELYISRNRQFKIRSKSYNNCSCSTSSACISQLSIYDNGSLFNVPGFYTGCYVIESLFQSTLECFYDQRCIDELQSRISSLSPVNVTALNESLPTVYSVNSTIKELVNNLMIEQWNDSSSFENYYNQCQPVKCTYTLPTNNDIIYIATALLGIAGGLTTILRLIIPRLVKLIRKKQQQQQTAMEQIAVRNSIRQLFAKSKHSISTFNLFSSIPPSIDEYELRTQRISTRSFIIIFCISLTILLFYYSLDRVTHTVSVETPTFIEYERLHSIYSQTITCPCSKISINYGKFLHVNYTFHQVCNSIFVDQAWIKYLSDASQWDVIRFYYRWNGPNAFQALRAFCNLIDQSISNGLMEFNSNPYISASVLRQTLFESEMKSLMNQFRSTLTTSFLLSLTIIRSTTQANGLFSALQSNYDMNGYLQPLNISIPLLFVVKQFNRCSCHSSSKCISPSFYDDFLHSSLFNMSNFYKGCNVIESLFQSTLECFYDQQCMDGLQRQMSSRSPMNVTVLDQSLSNHSKNLTIKELLDNLMIDQWNISPIFESYYNECKPIKCTFIFETNNAMIYIVTTLFGIAGGLITVLKLMVPRLIKLVRRKIQQQPITGINEERYIIRLWPKFKNYLRNLNLFPSVPPSTDENELRTQRISTRLFIIIFSISLTILLFYYSLDKVTKTVSVEAPTFENYSQLHSTYSETLVCPCSKISINYDKFLHVEYTLHPVCNSELVSQRWFDYLDSNDILIVHILDFKTISPLQFQALRILCNLTNETISNSLTSFYSNQYITASVIPQQSFERAAKLSIDKLYSALINNFKLSLMTVRDTTQANALLSATGTNYYVGSGSFEGGKYNFMILPYPYKYCDCIVSPTCTAASYISAEYPDREPLYVPGFYTGCYILESLFRTSLKCFYDQECVNKLKRKTSLYSSMNVTLLDESLSNYSKYSTIQELVDNLMIEQWNDSWVFQEYYNQCQPIQCTYTFETKNDIIYIFTTLFGVAGGLITVLELVLPPFVNIIMYCIRKQGTRIVPETSVVDT